MEYQFLLDGIGVEEPTNFKDIELSIVRDDETHGVGFEASTSALRFYGKGANYIRDQKEAYGLKANVIFEAQVRCDDTLEFETLFTGRLNFGKYKDTCGTSCLVSIPWEAKSCELILKSRYEQKVDVDKVTGADNVTALPDYAGLGIDLDIPARELLAAIDGSVAEEGDIVDLELLNNTVLQIRPTYAVERYNNINTGQLTPFNNYYDIRGDGLCFSPQFLYEDNVSCFSGEFSYRTRTKGRFRIQMDVVGGLRYVRLRLATWDGIIGSVCVPYIQPAVGDILTDNIPFETEDGYMVGEFDIEWSGTVTIPEGIGLYLFLQIQNGSSSGTVFYDYHVEFDEETYFTLEAKKACPTTTSKVYLIHETLSRITENITNSCMRVKSSYYGRVDSEPFAFDQDGCGGLRTLTSGLYLRKAPEPTFFTSLKDMIQGLTAIDNIGMGIEDDDAIPGGYILRIEDVNYFYQDIEIFRALAIPVANTDTEEARNYSIIKVGYKEWEPEDINGLDEINSNREYRSTIDTVNNTLDITSGIITGSYLIEDTRQQSFADSGGADTGQDNSVFLICVDRWMYGFISEKGGIDSPSNIYSPETVFNYRLSPLRNLMRWYKTILAAFPQLTTDATLFFNSGTANITASGELSNDGYDIRPCKLENSVLSENQTLYVTKFNNEADYKPIWKNELITFDYPMSVEEYRLIKSNPYGYITYQCGLGDLLKGYVKEIKYKIASGIATFTLRKKYYQ